MQKCDRCEAVMINGVYCHEIGCERRSQIFNPETGDWNEVYVCDVCGYDAIIGNDCCEM